MAVSTVVKTRRDGTISIMDSGATNTYVVAYEGAGDFAFENGSEASERVTVMDRGAIVGLRKGNDQVGTLSFSVNMLEFTNSTADNLLGAIDNELSWTSTGGTGFEPFLFTVRLTIEATDMGEASDAYAEFSKVKLTWSFSEGDVDTVNITGEFYGGITYGGIS